MNSVDRKDGYHSAYNESIKKSLIGVLLAIIFFLRIPVSFFDINKSSTNKIEIEIVDIPKTLPPPREPEPASPRPTTYVPDTLATDYEPLQIDTLFEIDIDIDMGDNFMPDMDFRDYTSFEEIFTPVDLETTIIYVEPITPELPEPYALEEPIDKPLIKPELETLEVLESLPFIVLEASDFEDYFNNWQILEQTLKDVYMDFKTYGTTQTNRLRFSSDSIYGEFEIADGLFCKIKYDASQGVTKLTVKKHHRELLGPLLGKLAVQINNSIARKGN